MPELKLNEVPAEEIEKRQLMRMAFLSVFKLNPNGPMVLERILYILHWFDPAVEPADLALQNAAKAILHELGVWGTVEEDRRAIVGRLMADK